MDASYLFFFSWDSLGSYLSMPMAIFPVRLKAKKMGVYMGNFQYVLFYSSNSCGIGWSLIFFQINLRRRMSNPIPHALADAFDIGRIKQFDDYR